MATFNFSSAMLDEGTTFIFGSWICVADGAGSFCQHLVDNMKPEAPAATSRSNLDEFIDNLAEMLLSDLAREIEEQCVFDATSTRAGPELLRSDLIRSEDLRTRFLLGLRNTATIYQEAMRFETLPVLEKNLDCLLEIGDEDATAYLEAPILDKYLDPDDDSDPHG